MRSFVVQLTITLLGLVIGATALGAPQGLRLPAEVVACLVGPGALYFRSFAVISDPVVRAGVSVIAVLGAWTGFSTVVLALGFGLSDRSAGAVLALVYISAIALFLAMGAGSQARSRHR